MVDETGKTGQDAASNESQKPQQAPAAAPASTGAAVPQEHLQQDIAQILKDVKLPERHAAELTGEHRPQAEIKPIDALLSGADAVAAQAEAPTAAAPVPTTPTPEASKPVDVPPPEVPKGAPPIVAVHTLKDDLQGVVREQKISVVRAAAIEADKRRGVEQLDIAPQKSYRGIILAMILLFVLGLLALFGVYYVATQNATPTPQVQNDSLVFAESSEALPLDDQSPSSLKSTLASLRNKNGSLGSISRVVPTITLNGVTRPATFAEFMAALDAQVPDDLLRALSDKFFLGFHTVDKNAPVIIVPVTSYDRAFAGMLAWEPRMNADLTPLFTPVPQFQNVNGIPTQRAFTDSVFRNYDVRTLSDDAGTIELYYSFPTRNILIIAESPYTFTEVLTRLQARSSL